RLARAFSARSTAPRWRTGSAVRSPPPSSPPPRAPTCCASTTLPRRPRRQGSRARSSGSFGAMDEPNGNGIESRVEVELRGISIYTHHGVSDAEQEIGQRLEFDISFEVPD